MRWRVMDVTSVQVSCDCATDSSFWFLLLFDGFGAVL
jgi:hypothetical protein